MEVATVRVLGTDTSFEEATSVFGMLLALEEAAKVLGKEQEEALDLALSVLSLGEEQRLPKLEAVFDLSERAMNGWSKPTDLSEHAKDCGIELLLEREDCPP